MKTSSWWSFFLTTRKLVSVLFKSRDCSITYLFRPPASTELLSWRKNMLLRLKRCENLFRTAREWEVLKVKGSIIPMLCCSWRSKECNNYWRRQTKTKRGSRVQSWLANPSDLTSRNLILLSRFDCNSPKIFIFIASC